MTPDKFCQSCTYPIDNAEDRGTEKDGTKSDLYCKYCYEKGEFTDPDMTLQRMIEIATTEMNRQNLPEQLISQAISKLPNLLRWKNSVTP